MPNVDFNNECIYKDNLLVFLLAPGQFIKGSFI